MTGVRYYSGTKCQVLLRNQVSGVSKQKTGDRKQKSDRVVLGQIVFTICLLSSDLCPLTPDT